MNKFIYFIIISSLFLLSNCTSQDLLQNALDNKSAYNTTEHLGIPIEISEITQKTSLEVIGKIPLWLQGNFLRNGPSKFKVGKQQLSHWFDGFAMLASFEFKDNKIFYQSQYLKSDQLLTSLATNSLQISGFAQNLGKVDFKHMSNDGQKVQTANANINIEKINDHYIALGETPLPIEFELTTLETKGFFDYDDNLKKANTWESAHMKRDPNDNTIYNFYIDYGRNSNYILYKIEDKSTRRVLLARQPVKKPSYMHDFSITENYIILTAYPLVVEPINLLNSKLSFMGAHAWEPKRKTRIYIFQKRTGKLVKELLTDPMFAFHHINAFEDSEKEINLYLNAYDKPDIVAEIADYPQNKYYGLSLRKLTINLKNSEVISSILSSESYEMPKIKEDLVGKRNKYFYSIWYTSPNKQGFGLIKYDIETNQLVSWSKEGNFPSEPLFIANPISTKEDDGVVLTIVFDAILKKSYLLILDARSMTEIARAFIPQILPFGLHGKFL